MAEVTEADIDAFIKEHEAKPTEAKPASAAGEADVDAYLKDRGLTPPDAKTEAAPKDDRTFLGKTRDAAIEFGKSVPTGMVRFAGDVARGEQLESEQRAMAFTDKPN